MSEARKLFEALANQLKGLAHLHVTKGNRDVAAALGNTRNAIHEALATQPDPGAVPELSEWSWQDDEGDLRIRLASKHMVQILDAELSPDDLDRIAEACTRLAARERARRAGS